MEGVLSMVLMKNPSCRMEYNLFINNKIVGWGWGNWTLSIKYYWGNSFGELGKKSCICGDRLLLWNMDRSGENGPRRGSGVPMAVAYGEVDRMGEIHGLSAL